MPCYDFGWLKAIFETKKPVSEVGHNREVPQPKEAEYKVVTPAETRTTAVASEETSAPPVATPASAEPPTTAVAFKEASLLAPSQHPTIAIASEKSEKGSAPPATIKTKNQGDHDILIAVMGATGVGKMTFIQSLATTFDEDCGYHGLDAGTKDVKTYEIDLPDIKDHLVLVDTPGFDDPTRPNAEVLEEIAQWMEKTYRKGRLLDGLIFLHRITDIRFDSGASKTLNIFRKLYGGKGFQRLALVTTMWNDVQETKATEYANKETKLRTIAWGSFLQRNANEAALVARFNSTDRLIAKNSALKVVADLLDQSINSVQLRCQLQVELVDQNKKLPLTEAGRAAFTLAETVKYYLREPVSSD